MTAPFSEDAFLSAIVAAGLAPVKPLSLPDGKIVRYSVEGDKAGSRNGWAVLNRSPILNGAFGSWRTGEQHTWKADSKDPLPEAEPRPVGLKLQQTESFEELVVNLEPNVFPVRGVGDTVVEETQIAFDLHDPMHDVAVWRRRRYVFVAAPGRRDA